MEAETAAFGYPRERLFLKRVREGPLAIRDKAPLNGERRSHEYNAAPRINVQNRILGTRFRAEEPKRALVTCRETGTAEATCRTYRRLAGRIKVDELVLVA